ncbi:hypothetical protein ACFL07_01215 [Pseudomonadota bacterium]
MSETQKTIDNIKMVAGIDSIDPAAVVRFINDTINHRPVDPADAMNAAVLLGGLDHGVRGGDDIGKEYRRLMKVRKNRTKHFDPRYAVMGSPAWVIVEQLLRKEIKPTEAQKEIEVLAGVQETKAKEIIKMIKPRVKQTLDTLDTLESMAKKGHKKAPK